MLFLVGSHLASSVTFILHSLGTQSYVVSLSEKLLSFGNGLLSGVIRARPSFANLVPVSFFLSGKER